jgi:hypothetical protein
MKPPSRKQLRQAITDKGITSVLKVPKSAITHKQRRFVEALVLDEMTSSDAYRAAYDTKANPRAVSADSRKLKANPRIALEIAALEQAKQVAALHTAEALRSLTISTLTSALIDPDVKMATKIQAAKILGQVTEVAAFTERKEITHVRDSGAIREQILGQLKTLMLASDDAQEVDASSLLDELTGAEPHPEGTPPNAKRDSDAHVHTIPLKQSPENSDLSQSTEHPPSSLGTQTTRGDIFGENDEVAK